MILRLLFNVLCLPAMLQTADWQSDRVSDAEVIRAELVRTTEGKDARIGVAVLTDCGDLATINGDEPLPMQSVYKFPQALAVAKYCVDNGISFSDTIEIAASQLHTDTYSPMRDRYGVRDLRLPIAELLAYSVQQSDNNACDVLFDLIGGTGYANDYIHGLGFDDIHIVSTEDDMHKDTGLCYANSSTAAAMARLLRYFDAALRDSSSKYEYIASLMETCTTGTDRLARGIGDETMVFGHKTGTGDRNAEGKIIAVNDVGYVHLANGRRYYIAVFVADSGYDMDESSALIAEVARIVAGFL
ncbi:MAG: class A beta-lactamase [Paramuribaculum sp.]|nr:class A beta-lactamase [Paramuribaculum sp.]